MKMAGEMHRPSFAVATDRNADQAALETFFFFAYQRLHEKKVAQVDASVPSLGMRQGDFNWLTTTSTPTWMPVRTP